MAAKPAAAKPHQRGRGWNGSYVTVLDVPGEPAPKITYMSLLKAKQAESNN